jgi:hypothetical protein
MADPIRKPDPEIQGRSRLQSEIDSKIVLAPRFGAITKADPLEVDPTVK